MNKNEKKKKAYMKPQIGEIIIECGGGVLQGSVSGGHDDAGDDEELGAKQHGFFDEEESPWQTGWGKD